jgi:hypothetical protein
MEREKKTGQVQKNTFPYSSVGVKKTTLVSTIDLTRAGKGVP